MRWPLSLILVLSVFLQRAVANAVSVGIYELPPHMMRAGEQPPQGLVPEFLFNRVFKPNKIEVRWSQAHFARILVDLQAGRLDMAVLVAKNKEREKKYVYSDVPLLKNQSGIVVDKNSKLKKIKSIKDLKGLRLGHDWGSIVPDYFEKSGANFLFISGEDYFHRGLYLLKSKRVDGFFVPTWSHGFYVLGQEHLKDKFLILPIPDSALDLYIIFNKNLDKNIIRIVNEALKAHASEYQKLLAEKVGS
ncbi:substrate-binding periplasmic protein [Bdellovibrio sp. HCB2-146]|uniref:substrate-binding periplasmic protein n=1 Tax=Bdellovibrio sp. HCB2-146 TaxID=3394362 RepID=UPI0039BCE658